MKTIRRSQVTRAIIWLLTLALIAPMLMLGRGQAKAQAAASLTVIVADFVDQKTKTTNTPLAIASRDAVYSELVASGQGRFNPIPEKEVITEAKTLGLKVPPRAGEPANFSDADLSRLARALNADAIVKGSANAVAPTRSQAGTVVVEVTVTDAASGDPINGGQSRIVASARPGQSVTAQETVDKAVSDAALDVTRQMVSRQVVTATVLNINQEVVLINRGTRDGLKAGDELNIIRDRAGTRVTVGKVRIARAYATDSEADVEQNVGGIQPEDFARVIYTPSLTVDLKNMTRENVRSTRVNFSSIGRTLTALGLGVVIAVALKGGQASTTDIVAEPTSDGETPNVRITWGDTVFGQGGVIEYHIYRDGNTTPNFPPGTPFSSGAGTSSTTTTTTGIISGVPIGTSTPTIHQYMDRPSPYFPYALTGGYVIASSNGGNNTSQSSSSSSSTGSTGTTSTSGCGVQTISVDSGFTPGHTYRYYVTAIILRTQPLTSTGSSSSTSSGTTSTGSSSSTSSSSSSGAGTGTGTGTGTVCLETDPVAGGYATPIVPVLPTSPANLSTPDISTFNPTWSSRNGADLFQVEVSTDRNFRNRAIIFQTTVFSSAPTQDGVQQSLPNAVNLLQAPQLLADPTFNAFVNPKAGVTSATPTLFYRIGARHDSDQPGPEDWITTQPSARDRTFRWVYGQVFQFQPAPIPPSPPGKAVASSASKTTTKTVNRAATKSTTATATRTAIRTATKKRSVTEVLIGPTRH